MSKLATFLIHASGDSGHLWPIPAELQLRYIAPMQDYFPVIEAAVRLTTQGETLAMRQALYEQSRSILRDALKSRGASALEIERELDSLEAAIVKVDEQIPPPLANYRRTKLIAGSTEEHDAAKREANQRKLADYALRGLAFAANIAPANSNTTLSGGGTGAQGPTFSPIGSAQTPLPLRATKEQATGAPTSATEFRLSERPANIRDAARALSREFSSHADELNRSKPNDAAALKRHDDIVALFERLATGLADLADALDDAITNGTGGKPEPVFLGKASEIARHLNLGLLEWLKDNRTLVIDVPIRMTLFGLGIAFLQSIGSVNVETVTALTVLALKRAPKSKPPTRKARTKRPYRRTAAPRQ